ncbi:uncharacterized protein LOC112464135 [Temnothorax curvispinosus]|uniref:Uncharacterized protein LOC112464135 n=1 Tax=Temnothorax curvispinosus TaxID=300111 RepID=A0A6J1QXX5_9HYME|nr:uncharacterized protein LOC112464135 [Temnothorax curvispinosus]
MTEKVDDGRRGLVKGEKRKEERQAERIIQCWDEKSTRIFAERTEEISLSEEGLLEKWEELRDKMKRALAELCEKKREEWSKREIEELNGIRTESEVWKYINKERKIGDKVSEEISMEGWRQHFMGVLEGTDERILEEERRGGDDEEDLTDEETEKQIRRLKRGKAAGPDSIKSEAWKFYSTAYKIYAAVLAERLMKDVVEKQILPETQADFRKGRGVMDNIFILNHLVDRELNGAGKKVNAFFIDLKGAFDRVDRSVLWRVMGEREVRRELTERVKQIYQETHLEEELARGLVGGMRIGQGRIWTLAYANNIVLLAREEEALEKMIKRLEKYLRKRKLELNVGKSKILKFRRGGGVEREKDWL